MVKIISLPGLIVAALTLSGCAAGLTPYQQSPNTVIATAYDTGLGSGALTNGQAAIAYDPDGCQGWIMDDGIEGYSGRRFDPITGLPICNGLYPPGTVLGNYQSHGTGTNDWVPGSHLSN